MSDILPTVFSIESDEEQPLVNFDRPGVQVLSTTLGTWQGTLPPSRSKLLAMTAPPSRSSCTPSVAAITVESVDPPASTSDTRHIPSEVIEFQTERSRMLAKAELASQSAKFLAEAYLDEPSIKKPPNTVSWIKLIRSRWILIQLRTGAVELWEIDENTAPTLINICHGIDGTIDGSVVEDDTHNNLVRVYVSTRSWIVYHFILDLPHRRVTRQASPKIIPSDCFHGFGGLRDVRGTLFAFSRTVGSENAGFVGDSNTAATVHLEPSADIHVDMTPLAAQYDLCRIKHEIIDMQVHKEFIIVARNCNVDIYSIAEIKSLLRNRANDSIQAVCRPFQSLVYPNLGESVYRGSLIREPNPTLGVEQEAVVLLSAELNGCYGAVIRRRNDAHLVSPNLEFHIEKMDGIVRPDRLVFGLAMGLSGRRFAALAGDLVAVYPTRPPRSSPPPKGRSDAFAAWAIPGSLGDVPGTLDFDETTGICVIAMASGRIWVVDAARFNLDNQPDPPLDFDKSENNATFIPNPDPARWPLTLPLPAPFGIDHLDKSPREVAPGWSDEVEKYFPYKNRPDCIGSTPWFIHEAAHIPILQPGYDSTYGGTYARTLLFTVDELDKLSIAFGYKEIIEVKPLPRSGEEHRLWLLQVFEQEWYFHKIRPTESLESIIRYLQRGGQVEGLLEDTRAECRRLDAAKVEQYLYWNFRYFVNFGRPGKKIL